MSDLFVDDPWDAIEACFDRGYTDGLPVVPPTEERVAAMLDAGVWKADEVLLHESVRQTDVTAHLAAVNAVLAGCRPEYFRVVGAALQAMGDPAFVLHGPTTSTGGAAMLLLVNGPIRDELAIHYKENLLGPGFRANATIGRAVRLVLRNCLTAIPGLLDKSTQGWAGKYACCFGEDEASSPWEPAHVSRGFEPSQSTVTVFAAESGHNIVNHAAADPEPLLLTFADSMAALGSFSNGYSLVVFCPEHARKIGDAGWSRERVQQFLYDNARRTLADLKRARKIEDVPGGRAQWKDVKHWQPGADLGPEPDDETTWLHRGWGPEDILLAVGGGDAGGHSVFFPSWSRARSVPPITRAIPEAEK